MRLRPYQPSDEHTVRGAMCFLSDLYPDADQWLAQKLADQTTRIRIATVGDVFAGMSVFTRKGEHRGKLSTVWVAPAFRAIGIGTALIQDVLDHAQTEGVVVVVATMRERLEHHLAGVFHRAGFQRTSVEVDRYGPGEHEAVWVIDRRTGPDAPPSTPASPRR